MQQCALMRPIKFVIKHWSRSAASIIAKRIRERCCVFFYVDHSSPYHLSVLFLGHTGGCAPSPVASLHSAMNILRFWISIPFCCLNL